MRGVEDDGKGGGAGLGILVLRARVMLLRVVKCLMQDTAKSRSFPSGKNHRRQPTDRMRDCDHPPTRAALPWARVAARSRDQGMLYEFGG